MAVVGRKPRCRHGEDCVIRTTKKEGENKGKSFYVCARPAGDPGTRGSVGVGRCDYFLWAHLWDAKAGAVRKAPPGGGGDGGSGAKRAKRA